MTENTMNNGKKEENTCDSERMSYLFADKYLNRYLIF